MKVKIEVQSWNNYPPPPHTHLGEGGGGLFNLPCTQGQLFMDAKLFNGTTIYQKFLLSPKIKVSKGAKIRNRYNQVPHLTQDTNGKVTNS